MASAFAAGPSILIIALHVISKATDYQVPEKAFLTLRNIVRVAMAASFFLLIVSLSEHIAFMWAYLASATACITLLTYYLGHALRSFLRGFGFGLLFSVLYGALYVLLLSEDNALILGAGLLFAALATVMVLTRKVDWHRLERPGPSGEAAPAESDAAVVA